jgi:acetophenone carboxylase
MPIPSTAEKLAWLKPAPATAFEKECAAKVQAGDYEIGVQITNDILDEAMEVFVRSSPAIQWSLSSPRTATS